MSLIQIDETKRLELLAERARAERDRLLRESDWAALPDVPQSAEWLAYRQALRDVPQQAGFPEAVEWPVAPNAGV